MRIAFAVCATLLALPALQAQGSFRLLRALSGPSGHTSGSKFVFDETRNRFVHPQDRTLIVYFEWDAAPGLHTLSGLWKFPGRSPQISTDIKIENRSRALNAYWAYDLSPADVSGVWTLEIRIDGEPAGSHSFEVVVPEVAAKPVAEAVPEPPSLDAMYRTRSPSLVWIYKLDGQGARLDVCTGFVFAKDRVATAFQCIDSAANILVEFSDGRKEPGNIFAAWNRLADWAILEIPTLAIPAIPAGDPKQVQIGQRLIVFNVQPGDQRAIGGVDIAGMSPGFGRSRFVLDPAPSDAAAGGPLLDSFGRAVGMLGGTGAPGIRYGRRDMSMSAALFQLAGARNIAIPVDVLSESKLRGPALLEQLRERGELTPPVIPNANFSYGGTTNVLPKEVAAPHTADVSEFSRDEREVWIYTWWQKRDKNTKGVLSIDIFDVANRKKISVAGKKMTIQEMPVRTSISFSPASLTAGIYRIDVLWEGTPAWRTWFRIVD